MNTTALTGEFNFWTSIGIWAPLLDSHLGSSRLQRSDGLVGWTKVDFAKQLVDKRCNSRAIVKCSASKLTLPFHPCSVHTLQTKWCSQLSLCLEHPQLSEKASLSSLFWSLFVWLLMPRLLVLHDLWPSALLSLLFLQPLHPSFVFRAP